VLTLLEVRLGLVQLSFAFGERRLGFLQLELSRQQRCFALGQLPLARLRCLRPLLDLGLASRQDLLGVGTVFVDRDRCFRTPEAEHPARAFGLAVLELAFPALDLELTLGDVCRALAEGALQFLDLDQVLGALVLTLLREPARKVQHLLAVGLILLSPRCLPTDRLPRILFHVWSVARDCETAIR
jgi:hypothetical protein